MKTFLITILALALLAAGAFFLFRKPSPAIETHERTLPTRPWAEVTKLKVTLAATESTPERELKTGDELAVGSTVQADRTGSAVIHFPDGSLARIEPETELTITEASFDPASERLVVRLALAAGRVWSKVFELATPDSRWEVKTANAVATVRGTSFGVGYSAGKSQIVSIENAVVVNAINLKTGQVISGIDAVITPNTTIAVTDEDTKDFKERRKVLDTTAAPADVRGWLERNREADKQFEQKLEEFRESGLEGKTLREKFNEATFQELERSTEGESGNDGTQQEKVESLPKAGIEPRTGTISGSTAGGAGENTPTLAKTGTLAVSAARRLSQTIVEGDQIAFRATLTRGDGSKEDVTETVTWQVLGPIGKIEKTGMFTASLDPSVSELGKASGTVIATWKNEADGDILLAKTPIFEVTAKVEEIFAPQG